MVLNSEYLKIIETVTGNINIKDYVAGRGLTQSSGPTIYWVWLKVKSVRIYSNSRDSSVGIALGYGLDDRGSRVRFPAGAGNFSLHQRVQNGPTQPPIQWVTVPLCLGIKRPGREADHSPPSSAEVKDWRQLHLHSPNTPPWRGAQLKKSTGTPLPYFYVFTAYQGHCQPISDNFV
jgi:hypothetical protein